jgi:fermentation-respiration switch protein FrsA (DUF1100 family)
MLGPLVFLLVLVGMLTLLVRLGERRLAFYPFRGEDATPSDYGLAFTPLDVATSDGETLRAWWMPADRPLAQVVYFHGNGGNLSLWSPVFTGLRRQGFSVLGVDYRGYGLSTGKPSEQGLYRDADATLEHFHASLRQPGVPVIYWGRSLGTAVAAYGASRRPPDGLILESGFPDARAVLRGIPLLWVLSFFSSYRFPTTEWLSGVDRPVLLIHATSDSIIPYRLGRELYERITAPKRFFTIEGGDHNDLEPLNRTAYWGAVREFVTALPRR